MATNRRTIGFRGRRFLLVLVCLTALPSSVDAQRNPAPPDSIRLMMVRFDEGVGPVIVLSLGNSTARGRTAGGRGCLGPPLCCREGNNPHAFRALSGRYSDGTIRSLLVRFRYDVPPPTRLQPDVFLVMDSVRRPDGAAIDLSPPTYSLSTPIPDAALLPAESGYLLGLDLVGPTSAVGDPFSRAYDANFERWGNAEWQTFRTSFDRGLTPDEAVSFNYYDRALANYAWWVRTANPEYWKRATYYVMGYRERYMHPNDYRVQPHNIQVEGLELHYLLTGDPSRSAASVASRNTTLRSGCPNWIARMDGISKREFRRGHLMACSQRTASTSALVTIAPWREGRLMTSYPHNGLTVPTRTAIFAMGNTTT